jgi:replicative DNA helicase
MPPQNLEAERSVLGACLLMPDQAVPRVRVVLHGDPDSVWYHKAHAHIWRAIVSLSDAGEPIDVRMIEDRLRRAGRLEEVGGSLYLAELWALTATAANAQQHAGLVMAAAQARRAIQIGRELADAIQSGKELRGPVARAVDGLHDLQASTMKSGGWKGLDVALSDAIDAYDTAAKAGTGLTGLSWGLSGIDRVTAGMQDGDLILLGARPSAGKSALAANIARSVAMAGNAVGIISLEMSTVTLGQRWLSSSSGVPLQDVRSGRGDVTSMTRSCGREAALPVWIEDTPGLSLSDICTCASSLVKQKKAKLIILDYLQLVDPDVQSDSTEREISSISTGLQRLARKIKVPILVLCQLSRANMARTDKRPQLSDLRSSGNLEQAADVVVLLHREEMYLRPEQASKKGVVGIAEAIIAKQRMGPLATVHLQWDGPHQQFNTLANRPAPGRYEAGDDQEEFK